MAQKKALILKLGAIGDVVMTIPAVRALYEQGYEIHWICGKSVLPLLECYSWITPILADDKSILVGKSIAKIRGILRLWAKISFFDYEVCATLYYDRRYRFLVMPVRASRKIALSRKSRVTTLLNGRGYVNEYKRVLLGLADDHREEDTLLVRPDSLPPSPLPPKRAPQRIAIVPGSASNFHKQLTLRRWPIELYVALAEELCRRSWEVVLVGGPDDAWVLEHFKHLKVTSCIHTLTLPELISVYDSCDGVVSHDTGPLHLAGLSSACLIGAFGPTDPSNFLPRRNYSVGIWGGQGFACRPCYDGHNFAPCSANLCMSQITSGLVTQHLDQLLALRSAGVAKAWCVVSPEGV